MRTSNFYVLTGGPGSGKTAIIDALKVQDYQTVDEVGRQIIQAQIAIGGNALHWGDRIQFRELMLLRSLEDFKGMNKVKTPVFFDRGIPDLIGYSYLINEPVPDEYWQYAANYRYNEKVFIAPPWQEIYQNDVERKQDFNEAIATYEAVKRAYLECDYQVLELPKSAIAARVDWMLSHIEKK